MDEAQFDAFHRAVMPSVYTYLARRTNLEMAQDVTSEVAAALWTGRERIPVPTSEQRAWAIGVARRQLAHARAEAARHHRLSLRLQALWSDGPDEVGSDVAVRVLDSLEARTLWSQLRPADREVLALSEWEGLSPADVSLVLGISVSTVTTRLHRARQRLVKIQALSQSAPPLKHRPHPEEAS